MDQVHGSYLAADGYGQAKPKWYKVGLMYLLGFFVIDFYLYGKGASLSYLFVINCIAIAIVLLDPAIRRWRKRKRGQLVARLDITATGFVVWVLVSGKQISFEHAIKDITSFRAKINEKIQLIEFKTLSGASYQFMPRYSEVQYLKQDLKRLGLYR